jgi:hypothetical protein
MCVSSCVYNDYLAKKLKEDCKYDTKNVATNNAIYAIVDILMLGSLDMMVVYPWKLDEEKRELSQNYPSKNAVNASLKSQAAEVDRRTANGMPSSSPTLEETHCCLSFRPLSSLSARISRRCYCKSLSWPLFRVPRHSLRSARSASPAFRACSHSSPSATFAAASTLTQTTRVPLEARSATLA